MIELQLKFKIQKAVNLVGRRYREWKYVKQNQLTIHEHETEMKTQTIGNAIIARESYVSATMMQSLNNQTIEIEVCTSKNYALRQSLHSRALSGMAGDQDGETVMWYQFRQK